MITVAKLHNLLYDFILLQGLNLKPGADQIPLRLFLPPDALNALMSDFKDILKDAAPDFQLDEDQLFYTVYNWVNVVVDICEGKMYRLENIVPNQEIEKDLYEDEPILPGYGPTQSEEIPKKKLQPSGPKTPKLELV